MSYTKKYILLFAILVIADLICIIASKYLFTKEIYTYLAIGAVTAIVLSFTPRKSVNKQ
ncbi:hypothetical protein SAMN05444144_10282 [Flavobacterium akiainvivens]|nr:hypothetical protein SAMN05444144_10282 [Flavobacterium akiainvivens]